MYIPIVYSAHGFVPVWNIHPPLHSNVQLYKSCVKGLVDAVFVEGSRCSIFAFGQTGSGKTFTMFGPRRGDKGLLELAAIDLLTIIKGKQWNDYSNVYTHNVYLP